MVVVVLLLLVRVVVVVLLLVVVRVSVVAMVVWNQYGWVSLLSAN